MQIWLGWTRGESPSPPPPHPGAGGLRKELRRTLKRLSSPGSAGSRTAGRGFFYFRPNIFQSCAPRLEPRRELPGAYEKEMIKQKIRNRINICFSLNGRAVDAERVMSLLKSGVWMKRSAVYLIHVSLGIGDLTDCLDGGRMERIIILTMETSPLCQRC
jgi:hypothetical protein